MPLDEVPNPDGSIVLDALGLAMVVPPGDGFDDTRYMTHWATCPSRSQHRKAQNAAPVPTAQQSMFPEPPREETPPPTTDDDYLEPVT